jgi:hypothetical protein
MVLASLSMHPACTDQGMVVIGQEGKQFIGNLAPDFELKPLGGGLPVKLSAQRGRTVMLVFWKRGGHALPLVDQADRRYRPKGLVIWTINYEDEDANTIGEFVRGKGYQFLVLPDRGGTVSRQYIRSGNTTAVIIAPSGKVVRYKQNFFGEDDFWAMLTDVGFRHGPPRNAYWIARHRGNHAHLRKAKLTKAQLAGASLVGAYLGGADLTNADLIATELIEADLRGANLVGARLMNTDLTGAQYDRHVRLAT